MYKNRDFENSCENMKNILRGNYEDRYNSTDAAYIRGRMGTEKGNQFIDTMYKTFKN